MPAKALLPFMTTSAQQPLSLNPSYDEQRDYTFHASSDADTLKTHVSSSANGHPTATYSRKEKSLGLLCENFLHLYSTEEVESISLDDAANRLGVERRRIYDIVNVLESVQVLVRKAKNRYTWHGYAKIPEALEAIKEAAFHENGLVGFRGTEGASERENHSEDELDDEEETQSAGNSGNPVSTTVVDLSGARSKEEATQGDQNCSPVSVLPEEPMLLLSMKYGSVGSHQPSGENHTAAILKSRAESRREKSLGLLSQKFVQLFLVSHTKIVSLEDAAKVLLGDCKESSKLKTKVRRLYDIANILSSLQLIEKTHETKNRKPAFKWLGVKDPSDTPARPNPPQVPDPCAKRARCSSSVESTVKEGKADSKYTKRQSNLGVKPLQPRNINVPTPLYNPVPCYPRLHHHHHHHHYLQNDANGAAKKLEPQPTVSTVGMTASSACSKGGFSLAGGAGWREWSNAQHQQGSSSLSSPQQQQDTEKSGASRIISPAAAGDGEVHCPPFSNCSLKHCCCPPACAFTGAACCCSKASLQQPQQENCFPLLMNFLPPFHSVLPHHHHCKTQACASSSAPIRHDCAGLTGQEAHLMAAPLHYQNEALNHMFAHYMEAWKSWYAHAAACSVPPSIEQSKDCDSMQSTS